MNVITSWSRSGEPIGTSGEDLYIPKDALRVSPKGAVYVYCTLPAVIVDPSTGKGIMRTMVNGSLILRAAPIIEREN